MCVQVCHYSLFFFFYILIQSFALVILYYRSEQIELCSSLLCCFVVVVFLIPRMINVLIEISSPFQPHLSNGHHVFFFRFNMLIYTNLFSHQTLKKSPIPYAGDLEKKQGAETTDPLCSNTSHNFASTLATRDWKLCGIFLLFSYQRALLNKLLDSERGAGGDWERLGGGGERLGGGGLTHIVGVRSCTTTRTNRSCKMWKAFTQQDITDSSPGKTQSVVRRRWQLAELCSSSLQ